MDYSRYAFSYERNSNVYNPIKPKKHKKISLELVFVASIVLVIFVVVICSEFLTDKGVISTLKEELTGKKSTSYYVVASTPFNSKSDALAQSTILRAGGCAGYIYHQNSQYFVAYATYFDKNSAQTVSNKNENTCILEFSYCNISTYKGKVFYTTIEHTVTTLEQEILNLNTLVEGLAYGSITDSDAITEASTIRTTLLTLKDYVYNAKIDVNVENALIALIEPFFGGLDALIIMNNSRDLLSGARYVITCEAINLSNFTLQ